MSEALSLIIFNVVFFSGHFTNMGQWFDLVEMIFQVRFNIAIANICHA